MSSLFDLCSLSPPNALHHPTFTRSHTALPSGFSAVRPCARTNQRLSFIYPFQKQTREVEAKRDRERNYKTCSQHSFQFNGRCSMSCFDKEWIWAPILSAISYQHMTYGGWRSTRGGGSLPKMPGCQFWGLKYYLTLISHTEIFCFQSSFLSSIHQRAVKMVINMVMLEWISSQADEQK